MRDERRRQQQLKIELLSQWKLEAESRNSVTFSIVDSQLTPLTKKIVQRSAYSGIKKTYNILGIFKIISGQATKK